MDSRIQSASSHRLRSHMWAGLSIFLLALAGLIARAFVDTRQVGMFFSGCVCLLLATLAAIQALESRLHARVEDLSDHLLDGMPDVELRLKALGWELMQAGFGAHVDLKRNRIVIFRRAEGLLPGFFWQRFGPSFYVSTQDGMQSFALPNGALGDAAMVVEWAKGHIPH